MDSDPLKIGRLVALGKDGVTQTLELSDSTCVPVPKVDPGLRIDGLTELGARIAELNDTLGEIATLLRQAPRL